MKDCMANRLLLLLPLLAIDTRRCSKRFSTNKPADVRRYTVEMIMFHLRLTAFPSGSEIFRPRFAARGRLDCRPLTNSRCRHTTTRVAAVVAGHRPAEPDHRGNHCWKRHNEEADDELLEEPVPFEIDHAARRANSASNTVYEHLDRLGAYEPLLHFGWTQPTYADRVSEPRPLSFFVTPPEGLEGDLNLYLSRYLHLAVNLQLDAPSTHAALNSYGNEVVLDYPTRYRINEDRIFRNGELRYFDHPKFGVLAKITRVEEPDEETTDDDELLGYDGE